MTKKKVIDRKYLPSSWPFTFTAVVYLYLDKFNAPGWLWGVAVTILGILWIVIGIAIFSIEQEEDIQFK